MGKKYCSPHLLVFAIIIFFIGCADHKMKDNEIQLWPEIDPFEKDFLKVSNIHEIYYELSGNLEGIPVFVIHGGPGAGSTPYFRRLFDPNEYLIVQHDQRGCGKSKPSGELSDNETQDLVEDIEQLRKQLGLDRIILFGGSWGSTLSLAYAEKYPNNIRGMVLIGIFLPTHDEEANFWRRLSTYYPDIESQCRQLLPDSIKEFNNKLILNLYLEGNDFQKKQYINAISRLEIKASSIMVEDSLIDNYLNSEGNYKQLHTSSLISYHYFANDCFLEKGTLISNASRIPQVPIYIVHGRYDMLCPPLYAFELHKVLPSSKLIINENAGHHIKDKPNEIAVLKIVDELKTEEDLSKIN